MRQAFGAFKAGRRSALRMAALAIVMLAASSCATLTGGRAKEHAEAQAEALRVVTTQRTELQAEVARLKNKNARLETKITELQRKVARAAASEEQANAAVAEAESKSAERIALADKAPSTAPAAPVVAAPNADVASSGAPVPVDESPRLVQPTFSSTEQIFENEAASPEIKMTSVLWGVHLASYKHMAEASTGWKKLQREYPDELGLLEPRIEKVDIKGKGEYLRLVGGGFSSREKAKALCDTLATKGLFCRVVNFGGERLSMLETTRLR